MGEHRQLKLVYYRGSLPLSDTYSVVPYLPQAPYPGAYRDDRTHLRTRFCAYKSRKARVVLQHADSLPAGYVVCVSQEIYRQIRDENNYIYMLCITVAVAAFVVGHKYRSAGLPVYWAWASAFMLIVVLASMKIKSAIPHFRCSASMFSASIFSSASR